MRLDDFHYHLPAHLIAQTPLPQRDQSRLMVVSRQTGEIRHDLFANMNRYLPKGSLIVLNNTKVVPARIFGKKERSDGKVEIFLLKKLADGFSYEALLRPRSRIKDGDTIVFEGSPVVAVVADKAQRIVRFNRKNLTAFLAQHGHVPLPPYIRRPDKPEDRVTYQTVYAKTPGSVAAPTAGLHFTKGLLKELQEAGHDLAHVTLHVNFGTFKPVVEPDIREHAMHSENYALTSSVWKQVQAAQGRKKQPIVAVGTTSCRVLESAAATGSLEGETRLFIYPGYAFQLVDVLVTNFHLPHSTLLMLVYAFGGMELMKRAYLEAIAREYRFFSYGDAMVIL